ncbi:PadR family transcriptional regulator [Acetobacterium tundrae]|uniref:PadR family transcriptional regulator n=1 Tax=Acetobacterium tundrae TaxID=132932 RepID=A0ABR6WHY6_9FIRM|nr:PadR family transcriptional regulator [Acetobacterium tundrae]MBC3796097.1 PadR family transcriptional regulator [Acetobacterium tundrae]
MIPSQMLKGTLEGSILAIISVQDSYGYEISRQLEKFGFGNISEGTIYPLLLRLEKNGLILAAYRESGKGPKRKYYQLSDPGKNELKQFFDSFEELDKAVHRLLKYLGEDNQ